MARIRPYAMTPATSPEALEESDEDDHEDDEPDDELDDELDDDEDEDDDDDDDDDEEPEGACDFLMFSREPPAAAGSVCVKQLARTVARRRERTPTVKQGPSQPRSGHFRALCSVRRGSVNGARCGFPASPARDERHPAPRAGVSSRACRAHR